MIKGNKGEWSELYVLLYLLGAGRLYAANEKVEKNKNIYFPILKIFRKESNFNIDYLVKNEKNIEISINGESLCKVPTENFREEANYLYNAILEGQNRAFEIARSEQFMKRINAYRLAAPASDKTDITIQVHDLHTGYDPIMGFSIKSELGNAPTLLNASKATNFVYEIEGINDKDMEDINSIDTSQKIMDRIEHVRKVGTFKYERPNNKTFADNLMLIDSRMEEIISVLLLYSYKTNTTNLKDICNYLDQTNPLKFPRSGFYSYKIKKLLSAIALGMNPSKYWDGLDEANGGYIIVTSNGDCLAYHLYNRNYFEDYLLNNTKLERASTSRHEYAIVYKMNDKYYMNLNLQIRFI